ncbi:hypothetical protein RRG08_058306 [Elysia crispata]|uniref:Uncharacterized protein n=1 Tax=Elysia crispata TaxID=231223 RepID=A0AAE1D5F0_9GAST|nr:hypothetical protein RRG08_058306 [Elysia crispata]
MNSQIYCLPQKFGWNTQVDSGKKPKKEVNKTSKYERPYFIVQLDGHEVSPQVREEFKRRYPKLSVPGEDSTHKAKAIVYLTETAHRFQPHFNLPKIKAPATFEKQGRADSMRQPRSYLPPFQTLMLERPNPRNDSYRGLHTWRRLLFDSHESIWQSLDRRDWTKEVSERNTLPPVRLVKHNATHEKERWDYARHLDRKNALSYPFRRDLVGYTGYKLREGDAMIPIERDTAHLNPAMESTTQAVHKEFSNEDYVLPADHSANKHQGPMSRMVTLTHPYNPFTQQSAYSHVGAAGTQ